jgi:hypothetical protein
MAKQIWIPKSQIVALPETMDALEAAMLEPLGVANLACSCFVKIAALFAKIGAFGHMRPSRQSRHLRPVDARKREDCPDGVRA